MSRICFPIDVTLVSSNVSESLYSEWLAVTAYTAAPDHYVYVTKETDTVTDRTPHKIFKVRADNTNKYPPDNTGDYWYDAGGTNRWAMFDEFLDTQTENDDEIVVSIDASNCDRLMLFNLDATEVSIELTDNDASEVVLEDTYDLSNGDGTYKTSLIEWIYIYSDATLEVTITKTGSKAKCGFCRCAWSTYIGRAVYGINTGTTDYSIKDAYYISAGAWSQDIDAKIEFDLARLDDVVDDLVAARGSMIGFEFNSEDTDYDTLRAYAFIQNWEIFLKYYDVGIIEMTTQGGI